jgi:hypothetical protein
LLCRHIINCKINHVSESRTHEANALNTANFYCSLSISMGQNILWEDSGYLGKELFRFTCNLSCHYPVQNVPPPVCILCPILTVRTILHCLLKIYFKFPLTYILVCKLCSRIRYSYQNFVFIYSVYLALLVTRTVSYVFF